MVIVRILPVLALLIAKLALAEPTIIDRPITFDKTRVELTKDYIRQHYGIVAKDITIVPKAIVVHWTATPSLKATWRNLSRTRLHTSRRHILRGGALNVSAHFLVDRDGSIYRLMPETQMARHCIGLNYDAIGIENVGGGKKYPLTAAQRTANVKLIRYLSKKHKTIRYLLGHMEWKRFEGSPIFREKDATYRNAKQDPGKAFMAALRKHLAPLKLLGSYTNP
jgi:N-acetylmuramoyl-L-alanine amidase